MKKNRLMAGFMAVPAVVALTLSLVAVALAGPLDDAATAYKQGDYVAAKQYAQQAVQESPNNPKAYIALGTILNKQGDKAGAKSAWDNVFRLDPRLNSVNNDAGFIRAYRSVGGDAQVGQTVNTPASRAARGSSEAQEIIRALTSGSVYVHPDLRGEVDQSAIEAAAKATAPTVVKVVVVPKLGPYPSRAAFADDLRKQLDLGQDGAVVVATPEGVSGVSKRMSREQVEKAFDDAGLAQAFAQGGLNAALPVAVKAFNQSVTTDRRDDTNRAGGIGIGILALIGGGVGIYALKRKREMDEAKQPIEDIRQEVIKNLSYVDGYLDLLPAGADADRAKSLRASAYAKYAQASATIQSAKRPDEVRAVYPLLQTALEELNQCRVAIDKATGGTGVAMAIPEIPDLSSEATKAARFRRVEDLRSKYEADQMQREIENIPESERGVSFFSGQPMPKNALVPVQIVIDGQKRTVMATRDEAEQIKRGQTPAVRAFDNGQGQYIPWYENRGYDPYRNYYGGWGVGDGLGTFVNLMLLSHLFSGGGIFGGYGGWGGWGGYGGYGAPVIINNNYGGDYGNNGGGFGGIFGGGGNDAPQYDPNPDHSGGFDFFGQGGYNEQSSDGGFGFGDSGDGGDSGFDFGGGDSGGGDFGGGDFGGGDFGGGDW